jgi:hypothetical protein
VSSIPSIAPVRDVPVIGQRNRANSNQLGPKRLSPDQERVVQELAQVDQKVRAHEAAHQAAAGSLGGAVSYTYETGPDGKSYAVGGEVPVDISSGRTPEETVAKAEQIRAAALAPEDPSPQDLSVAAQASQIEAAAREQIMQQQLAAMHASRAGHSAQAAVLGPQALHGRDVKLSRSDASKPATSPTPGGAAAGDQKTSSQSTGSEPVDVPDSSAPDVAAQAEATLATLESDRAAAGATNVQVQQLARLAMAAYGL